ncbi:MAG: PTS sugar transporter subunit IIA [Deltaproteobacteria bacterium]|nr:PTS sugar transporter subunit IIA [Deltaproteobacteria bacterium]
MDLSIRDLTRLFEVSEKTVYRWIKERALPSHKVQDRYRFNRQELLEWARNRRIPFRPEIFEEGTEPAEISLTAAVTEGGIHYRIAGKTKEEAFDAIARLAKLPPSFGADELTHLLLAREAMASTGIGQGVAIPHVRDAIVLPIEKPAVALCFLQHPIDFGAVDGQPVHTFFLLLSSTVREHLRLLSKIAFLLHDPVLLAMLVRREKAEPLLSRIRAIEEGL